MSKIFGPFIPQDVEKLSVELNKRRVPFQIHSNEEDRKAEISNSPENLVALAEFRTRNALGQMFYLELEEKDLNEQPDLEAKIWKITTGEDIASMQSANSDSQLPAEQIEREQFELRAKIAIAKSTQRKVARLLLVGLIVYILFSVYFKK